MFTFFIYLYFCSTYTGGDMQNSILSLSVSIAQNGTFQIASYQETSIDVAYKDGQYYSGLAPGASFWALPCYYCTRLIVMALPKNLLESTQNFLQQYRQKHIKHISHAPEPFFFLLFSAMVSILAILFSASTVALLYALLLYHTNYTTKWATYLTACFAFGSPFFGYGAGFYTQSLALSFLLWGCCFCMVAEEKKSNTLFFIGSLFASFSGMCDYPYFVYGFLTLFPFCQSYRRLGYLTLGYIIPLLLTFIYHAIAFGNIFATPYHFRMITLHQNQALGLTFPPFLRLLERLFSIRDGIITTFPILLVLTWCIKKYTYVKMSYLIIILFAMAYTIAIGWPVSSEAGMGARFFLVATAYTMIVIAPFCGTFSSTIQKYIIGLCIFSILLHTLGNSVGPQFIIVWQKFIVAIEYTGFSSFFLRNITEHIFHIPPYFTSFFTLFYITTLGLLCFAKSK